MKLTESPDILIMGHPVLFQVQPDVSLDELDQETFKHNLQVLRKSQIDSNGIGIAAPQIDWPVRVFSVGISNENRKRYPQAPKIDFAFWINPQIIDSSKETCWTWEACLSIPGMRAWVERPKTITLCGYNEKGKALEVSLDGFPARVIQHELDHLDGILFPMRVDDKQLIIPNEAIEHQSSWAEDWPTDNARNTPRGQLSLHR